jgi:type IV secretion system protein VirB10
VNGNPVPTNGQQTPAQTRAQQARAMADAARRSPIMAFGSSGIASGAAPSEPDSQAPATGPVSGRTPEFWRQRLRPPSTDTDSKLATAKGPSDFSDQLDRHHPDCSGQHHP